MMTPLRIIPFVALIALGGCAQLRTAYHDVTTASVSPQAVILAADTFDAIEVTATNYLRLKRCTGANAPICRDPTMTPAIKGAVYSGRIARNNLKSFLRAHPGELGPKGDYDALIAATETVKAATAAYVSATR